MNIEERKVIQLGRSLGITFPKTWVQTSGISKGDMVTVYPLEDGGVFIYPTMNNGITTELYEESKPIVEQDPDIIAKTSELLGITISEIEGTAKEEKKLDISALVRAKLEEVRPNY